jgi:hypothetical protein
VFALKTFPSLSKDIEEFTFPTSVLPLEFEEVRFCLRSSGIVVVCFSIMKLQAEAILAFRNAQQAYIERNFFNFVHDAEHYKKMTEEIEAKMKQEHRDLIVPILSEFHNDFFF